MAKYDDLIEEASGELDRVETQLYSATQELLDLQGKLSQLSQESYAAEKSMLRVTLCTAPYKTGWVLWASEGRISMISAIRMCGHVLW